MDRIWQRAWDRYGPRYYIWWLCAAAIFVSLPIYSTVVTLPIIAFEKSSRYSAATAATVAAVVVLAWVMILLSLRWAVLVKRWGAGQDVDPQPALEATYTYARTASSLVVWVTAVWAAVLSVGIGAIAGAPWARLTQYGFRGALIGAAVQLIAYRSMIEGMLRPVRIALIGDSGIGDTLPRSRPTFAARSNLAMIAVALGYGVAGAMLATAFHSLSDAPFVPVVIGGLLTIVFAVPVTVGLGFSQSLKPIRDLAAGAERVALGDYNQPLPVVQDDDLGVLAGSFNRMQTGLAERQRLQGAFGTYVDPALASRLLEQGDDVFTGERREVTVMFIDIRDFTPFAEANTAEDTVARLNALFEIVVPAVVDAGGHVNKFLGDGALAVFGAPNDLANHADQAVSAAGLILRRVEEQFGGAIRIGVGINTGVVIAGTIGGGGKLEFTLIGDAVNVAARLEQLTKSTGDVVLLSQSCVNALECRPPGLIDRGSHTLKGKSAAVQVFTIDPAMS